jgi:hypothetical protein
MENENGWMMDLTSEKEFVAFYGSSSPVDFRISRFHP